MNDILVCTHDPILMKNVYGILRDEGFAVDISDSPGRAVQMVIRGNYGAVIMDTHAFGLPVEDAVPIIKTVSPNIQVILIGHPKIIPDSLSVRLPLNLEELRETVHSLRRVRQLSQN